MAAAELSTSASLVAQELMLIRIAARPFQVVPPHQQVPSSWIAAMTRCVRASSPKATNTWFRSDGGGVGTQCGSTLKARCSPYLREHAKNKKNLQTKKKKKTTAQ